MFKDVRPPTFSLRPARESDREWLVDLRRDAYRELNLATFGDQDERRNRRHADECRVQGNLSIVRLGDEDVGMVQVLETPNRMLLEEIQIHPAHQRKGLGEAVLRDILDRASRTARIVTLSTGLKNERARRFYERLGFRETGASETHRHMELVPRTPSPHERRRESFDEVAELYDRARPGYPESLVQDLASLAQLTSSSRVLEIGAATGQFTIQLAKTGVDILAVELGANLANVLRENVAHCSNVRVVVDDFDAWQPSVAPFDLVVVATAFHWLNPATRAQKTASLLRPGGKLAIIETHWVAGGAEDGFSRESQSCYAQWDPGYDPASRPREVADLKDRNEELEKAGAFESILHRRYFSDHPYSASEYCDLLATFSDVRAFDETAREAFLSCISDLIDARFQGTVTRHAIRELWLGLTSV